MVAVDAEDRKDKPLPLIRMTARIEPEWLIELFPDHVREHSGVEWNRPAERVEAVSALLYDELVIQESRGAAPDAEAAAGLLAQKALEAGIDRFVDQDAAGRIRSASPVRRFRAARYSAGAGRLVPRTAKLHGVEERSGKPRPYARAKHDCTNGWMSLPPHASGCRMGDRRKSTTSLASRPGSRPVCRTFSACEKRRGSGGSRRRWWSTCWRPINGRYRRPRTLRDSGSGCIRKSGAS